MSNVAEEALERLDQLKSGRHNFESLWQDVHDVMNPHGGDFNVKRFPGEKRTEYLFEQTAANSLEKFTAGMEAFNTPRHQRWSRVRATVEELNDVAEVRAFFESTDRVLEQLRNSPRARFYGQTYEYYKSLGETGNGCLFVDEIPSGGVRYRFNHVGQTYMDTNHESIVDTVYYEYELTARAAVQKWGDKAPACATNVLKAEPGTKHKYVHCVRPRNDRDMEDPGPGGRPFESLDISCEDRALVGPIGGYEELPYIWGRYTVSPGEMYGRGPGMLVLPDVCTLQEMQKTFLRSGRKVADPPLLVHDDSKLGRGSKKIRLEPGGLNVGGVDADGRPMIQPLITGARLDITDQMMDKLRENIEEAFLVPLIQSFLANDRPQMTAYEAARLEAEKGQSLTPVIGRQQAEFLGPLIEREIGIAMRQGLLPPLPDALVEADGEYEIEYETDATRLQRSSEVAGFFQLQEMIDRGAQVNPGILEKIDWEEAIEHYGHDLGVPEKLIRSEEDMEEIHARQQQDAAASQLAEQGPPIAGMVSQLAEVDAA